MSYNKKYHIVGVMSGTSLDGIDLAECTFRFTEKSEWYYTVGKTETIPYAKEWKTRLQDALHFLGGRMQTLNEEYTHYLSGVINTFIKKHDLNNLDAVCSHGHTILHQPERGLTLQIGNLPNLAALIQQTVVCDFRVQDVQLGGQGAPLVPIGDRLLFSEYDYCLNLGGFANVSSEENGKRIAYDICPVNIVLNHYALQLGFQYDDGGNLAKSGTLNQTLLKQLNALEFYEQPSPKSLGLEWVQSTIFPLLDAAEISVEDKLRTFAEHVAVQLSVQFNKDAGVLITGGGVYNGYLLERLQFHKKVNLEIPSEEIIEYKEALVFGLLGVLKLRGEVNCLASVTGAEHDHCSGKIYVV